jgi:hypothetical protein
MAVRNELRGHERLERNIDARAAASVIVRKFGNVAFDRP